MARGTSGGRNGRTTTASPRSSYLPQPSCCLLACPFRWSFVEEGNDTLTRVCGRDKFFEVNLFSSGQPFVKVNRIPRVNRLLGVGERDGTQLPEFGKRALDNRFELLSRHRSSRQAHRRSFVARELASSKDEFGGAFLTNERGQHHGRDRRIAPQLDFRKSPTGIASGVNDIADGGEFRASAEARSADGGNGNFARGHNGADHRVEAGEHFVNLLGEVGFDVHTGGEGAGITFEHDNGNVGTRFSFQQKLVD